MKPLKQKSKPLTCQQERQKLSGWLKKNDPTWRGDARIGHGKRVDVPAKSPMKADELSTATLASMAKVHPQTIRRMVAAHEIDFTAVGGSRGYVFPECAVKQVREAFCLRAEKRRKIRARRQAEKMGAK